MGVERSCAGVITLDAMSTFTPFDADGGLTFATRLPGSAADFEGGRRSWGELGPAPEPPALWINLDRMKERAKQWLREESGLEPLVSASLLAEETRPRVQKIGDGLLVNLRGVNLNPGAEPDELIAIRMWIEPTRIITLRQFKFQTIAALRERAQRGEAPATPGGFLASVAGGIAERLGPTVSNLEEMLDEIEESMLEDGRPDDPQARSKLATIRRQAITYRRHLVPQRDAMMALLMLDGLFDASDEAVLRFGAEQVTRVVEALEEVRDRAAVTTEEIRARQEARISRTLYLLTIVATIALPLGLITGLFGINVGGMPWIESGLGFGIVCGAMVVIAGVELVLFKVMRWI